jgi:hypothetical protein
MSNCGILVFKIRIVFLGWKEGKKILSYITVSGFYSSWLALWVKES